MPFEKGHPPYPRRGAEEVGVTTEILASPEIRRFTADRIDDWLLGRLEDRWPGTPEFAWRGKVAGFNASNAHLLVESDLSVLLMDVISHPVIPNRVEIREGFVWSRAATLTQDGAANWWVPKASAAEDDLVALYRYALKWGKSMKAIRANIGRCSDLAPSTLKGRLSGDYLVDVLL